MRRIFSTVGLFVLAAAMAWAQKVASPNGKVTVERTDGIYEVRYNGNKVVDLVSDGVLTKHRSHAPAYIRMEKLGKIKDNYQMLQGKRLSCSNRGNAYAFVHEYADGSPMRLVMRLYDNGVAFRYELQGLNDDRLKDELTYYNIGKGTRRWFMKWSDGYEGFFPEATSGEGGGRHWAYPALLQKTDNVYALISEANIERRQSASSMRNDDDGDAYKVCPDVNDVPLNGEWHTPWRVLMLGSLADIVESTLVTDVSDPCRLTDTSWIKPGVVSWVYWAYNHGSNDFNIIKKYVDLAAALKLPYVLIDAEWDEFKDGKSVVDAIDYAKQNGVKPMIWYNSSVGWINGAPGPKFRLNKPEDREREFAWCESLGVAGVKIDFFSGDNQMNMDYCIDLLECAARHHLLVNFHGATIPRGWQRTYANLMSTEGVYGAEWYNNVPTFTAKAAEHNATLPFTRNVVGPMDYTPCAFSDSQHPHITTHAHELALTVLFESGLQHLADRPESFLAQPQEVRDFLSNLPNVWDDTKLVAGYPGDYVVMARKSKGKWYIAAINGTDDERDVTVDWSRLKLKKPTFAVYADSGKKDAPWVFESVASLPTNIYLQPRGGVVMVEK